MKFSENELRDFLFENHKDTLGDLIIGKREPIAWDSGGFPPLRVLLQRSIEKNINKTIDALGYLILSARELRLEKTANPTTRIDLFGACEGEGMVILELKKSKQTERQAFTELLAYANHFCSIFPGLTEKNIITVLIAPMETRTVKDAFVQEILGNGKHSVALIPEENNGEITLTVYYPDESYYHWFENNLLDDQSMGTVAIAFPELEGWIDTDKDNNQVIPQRSKEALNTISSAISLRLEACGFHTLVYATQKWGEIGQHFPFPNIIFVVYINPFAAFRNDSEDGKIYGQTAEGRVSELQAIYDQMDESDSKYWLESLESDFRGIVIHAVNDEFKKCFKEHGEKKLETEISLPDWYGVKTSVIESVYTHNLDIYQTGILREIYMEYLLHAIEIDMDEIHYYDALPKYSYECLRDFLAVWQILSGLGLGQESA